MNDSAFDIITANVWLILPIFGLAIACSLHAIIFKRNHYAAFAWLGFILLSPAIFSLFYLSLGWLGVLVIAPLIASLSYIFLGINTLTREFRQAKFLHRAFITQPQPQWQPQQRLDIDKWRGFISLGDRLAYSPLQLTRFQCFEAGDQAYASMLNAIDSAESTISLHSYIFKYDAVRKRFCQALIAAKQRGVEVKVMMDAVGSHKSFADIYRQLHAHAIDTAKFMPMLMKTRYSNLRNHRKLLLVDAKLGFTGGLNIAADYSHQQRRGAAIPDIHFKLEGGLVNYLQEVFVNDWHFATQQALTEKIWFNQESNTKALEQADFARLIVDGPSDDEARIRWHFLSIINHADASIKILTPYFLPDNSIQDALSTAAMRGVEVEIIVPDNSDHKILDRALIGSLHSLLTSGCRIYRAKHIFDHSKLIIIDDRYVSIGSANWDARSLRLNYELNIEIFEPLMIEQLKQLFANKKSNTFEYTLSMWLQRTRGQYLIDGVMRLLAPYL